jgi:FKBP-type peptidyl-prolyl cis-trans isomerase (trigger factor)
MAKSVLAKTPDGTITLSITIPWEIIKKTQEQVIIDMAKEAKLPGFRKGKVPLELVKDKLDRDHINENILKKLPPEYYAQAVNEHKLDPIMNPKIHIEKIEEGKDWSFSAQTCDMPVIELGDYKAKVKDVTAKSKIIIPGKEQQKPSTNDIIKKVLESTQIKLPQILINQETDRLLAQLLSDLKKLGLDLEQYLASTNRSAESLREEYGKQAEENIALELVLQKIADNEKISIDPQEIQAAIDSAKDPNEKQNLEQNRYLVANILRRQKTLDFLTNL